MMAPLETRKAPSRVRLWYARLLWRAAFVLLAAGGFLLRNYLISPVSMRRIWHCADYLERQAERLRYSL